jgi:hypothetical protein
MIEERPAVVAASQEGTPMRTTIARVLVFVATFVTLVAAPAAAKTYWAERFDSTIRVLPDGAIEVTELVVYRFDDGTFDHVFRDIPRRRTDRIEVRYAEMDGRRLPFGSRTGEVEVSNGSPVRVRWRFAPRSGTTHAFTLNYIARGVIYKRGGADLLEWVALPTKHAYRIETSRILIEAPVAPAGSPIIDSARVTDASVEPAGERVQIAARGIGNDGWVKVQLAFPDGSLIAAMPAWQQRHAAIDALAPRWLTAAGLIVAVGLVLIFALWQRYDAPPRAIESSHPADTPPDTLRPALAGAVASNGGVKLEHAMAALFTLADRGAVTIVEEPRRWGQRRFTLHRHPSAAAQLAPEEAALLEIAFKKKDAVQESVSLAQARGRIGSRIGTFKKTVKQALVELGLLDDERVQVRSRYVAVSIAVFVLAGVLAIPAAGLTSRFEGWPFLIPAALVIVGVVGLIFYGALTPLSNEGVRRAERWRSYQRYLKDVARDRAQIGRDAPAQLLPFAIALGLASAWSKFIKHHPQNIPPWFQAMGADSGGFPAFVASGGAADGGGGAAAGGGGAAGGGAAGAG